MASKSVLVDELMTELGKKSSLVRKKIDQIVGEVTLDLLSQNNGQFSALEREQAITTNTSDLAYKLNTDFNAVKPPAYLTDVNGKFSTEFAIVSLSEFMIRQGDTSRYPGASYARIEYLTDQDNGPGDYLILGTEPDSIQYVRLPYYRKPKETDTHLIRNETIVKIGAKSKLPEFNEAWSRDQVIYFKMRSGFKEDISKKTTELVLRPSSHTRTFNESMHNIGSGG